MKYVFANRAILYCKTLWMFLFLTCKWFAISVAPYWNVSKQRNNGGRTQQRWEKTTFRIKSWRTVIGLFPLAPYFEIKQKRVVVQLFTFKCTLERGIKRFYLWWTLNWSLKAKNKIWKKTVHFRVIIWAEGMMSMLIQRKSVAQERTHAIFHLVYWWMKAYFIHRHFSTLFVAVFFFAMQNKVTDWNTVFLYLVCKVLLFHINAAGNNTRTNFGVLSK